MNRIVEDRVIRLEIIVNPKVSIQTLIHGQPKNKLLENHIHQFIINVVISIMSDTCNLVIKAYNIQ